MDQANAVPVKKSRKKVKDEPFVSVLTPVYNDEKFLRECIESVLNQDYANWEYVLVNNKSTDNSSQIIEEYARCDKRIRIHNNKVHLPQMKNFNHAWKQISPKSKYCKFLCADDWLYPNCISKMVEVMEEHPSVGIVSAYRLDDKKVGLSGLPYSKNFFKGREIARNYFLHDDFYFGSPTSLLIRSELTRKRDKVYEESHQATDTPACLDLLKESDFGFVHRVLTYTRRHENSIMNTEAQETYAWIHAKLFSAMKYGPYFLTDEEYQKILSADKNRYYIMLSRNLFENRSIKQFKKQLEVLKALDLPFETSRFLKNMGRESILQFFKLFNIELRRSGNG